MGKMCGNDGGMLNYSFVVIIKCERILVWFYITMSNGISGAVKSQGKSKCNYVLINNNNK